MERFFLLSYCLACCWGGLSALADLRVVRQWAEMDFVFPSEEAKNISTANNFYVPGNSVPIDVDVQYRHGREKSRIFVTMPRFGDGRPVTLGTVEEDGRVSAYPDWSWNDNQGSNCDGFTSVFRVAIDQCNRLWAMDTGKIGEDVHCSPQLLAFDLNTDRLLYRHRVNASSYTANSRFVTPVVDVRSQTPGDCSDTFVYVADVNGYGILVVDVANDRSWRITNSLFHPNPNNETFTIEGESFELTDGVVGMALSPIRRNRDRNLYFHALASTTENVVKTAVLRDASNFENPDVDPTSIKVLPGQRPTQSAAEAMDRNGILYFGLMEPPSIYCWNTATEFNARNLHPLSINRETLQFASGVKVIDNIRGEQELWVITNRFQKTMTGTLNSTEINFRIHTEKIDKLLVDSPCRQPW